MSKLDVIALSCPKCGNTVKVKSDAAGKKVRCPEKGCDTIFDVPGSEKSGFGTKAQLMTAVGIVFALIAAVFTIRQMDLATGWLVSMALVGLVVISEFLKGIFKAATVALFLLVGLSTPALFFILERRQDPTSFMHTPQKEWAFIVGAALYLVLSGYLVFRMYQTWIQFDLSNTTKRTLNLESAIVWSALIASSVAFAWVAYYKFLTRRGDDGEEIIWRRLVFTLSFVVVGVICTVFGRKSPVPFLTVMGLTYMAAGVVKALAYDIFKTQGWVRIGVFAGCGAVLLLGGFLMKGSARPRVEAAGEFAAVIED